MNSVQTQGVDVKLSYPLKHIFQNEPANTKTVVAKSSTSP